MLLSCLPVSLYKEILSGKMSLKEWLILAKSLDLDGADISVMFLPHKSPVPLGKIRRMTQTVGIPIMMMATYTDFTQPNPEIRERELACAIADIAAASELNIPFCRITAGQYYEDQNDQETVKTVAELLAQCDYYAGRWGVTLLLENHSKPGVWDKPDFVFNTKRFLLLYEQIKTLNIGINFDTANTYALGDDSVELFRKVYPRVRSIHVNDLREAYTLDFVSPGTGSAPIAEVFREARALGFDGLLSIEETQAKDPESLSKSIARTRSMWENARNASLFSENS